MRAFGVIVMIVATLILLYGFAMSVAAPGSSMVNLGLMQDRLVLIVLGGALLLLGGIFVGLGKGGAAIRTEADAERVATDPAATKAEKWRADMWLAEARDSTVSQVRAARGAAPAAPPAAARDEVRVPCPHCAEAILPAARICRYCGLEVAAPPASMAR